MGGRSRKPSTQKDQRYAFLKDISDDRLQNYGNYSSAGYLNRDAGSITQSGIPKNPVELNHRAADEYIQRTGIIPIWDLRHHSVDK